jgi:pimeloyl-ACP methyl ester carboxylesterase
MKVNEFHILVLAFLFLFNTSCTVSKQNLASTYPVYFEGQETLGNFPQSVIVRGTQTQNPVLIHLHGGPGYPLFPFLASMKSLEKEFTMVYWEQRGNASSFSKQLNKNSMQTDSLLRDLDELVHWVQQKYGVQKVFIWGHSWGTNLGMLYAAKHPENIWAYVGTGQSVNLYQNERLCYNYALSNAQNLNDKKALKQLHKIDTSEYMLSDALLVRKWLYAYGGIVHSNQQKMNYINLGLLFKVLHTPAYTCKDKMHLLRNRTFSGTMLWDDMMLINLYQQVPEITVPVYFFEGRYDHLVSSELAYQYFDALLAPQGKHWVWFEESAHRPQTEETQKFLEQMLKVKSENFKPKKR